MTVFGLGLSTIYVSNYLYHTILCILKEKLIQIERLECKYLNKYFHFLKFAEDDTFKLNINQKYEKPIPSITSSFNT